MKKDFAEMVFVYRRLGESFCLVSVSQEWSQSCHRTTLSSELCKYRNKRLTKVISNLGKPEITTSYLKQNKSSRKEQHPLNLK